VHHITTATTLKNGVGPGCSVKRTPGDWKQNKNKISTAFVELTEYRCQNEFRVQLLSVKLKIFQNNVAASHKLSKLKTN